ncbi:hypothetical protein Bcav_2225 [Beutenbergia cavernae DSM 12333]|uniref:Uncharacterized protein n=2 Tax=Beutenbergia TaxID=84756 RepID=C5BV89_BEUC1|nr:hypothetical protein Bcav_2225 [Beutenbergia cavernae DSM 12333]
MTDRDLRLVSPGGDRLPPAPAHHNEGKTVAGWTTNWLLIVGAVIVGVGMILPTMTLVYVGGGVIVLALLIGALLKAVGRGQPRRTPAAEPADG